MSIILDCLPEIVEIDGTEYPIQWDFRTSIYFELLMQDDELSDSDKIREALDLYYPKTKPRDLKKAVEKLIWFYRCGKEPEESRHTQDDGSETTHKQVYSFEHDADYIYAAYLAEYGIDLTEIEDLHWWKFRALFRALPDSCEFVKIMGYRSMKISSKMSKEQRAFYRKMQAIHALPTSQKEREQSKRLVDALMNGGDLTGLL